MEFLWVVYLVFLNFFVAGSNFSRIYLVECGKYRNVLPNIWKTTVADDVQRKFPFMVTVHANISSHEQFYNGMLINKKFVLLSASGLQEPSKPVVMLTHLEKAETIQPTYDVIETSLHPNFDTDELSLNMRLLKLNESTESYHVTPACISAYDPYDPYISMHAIQIAWRSNDLGHIKSYVMSKEDCKRMCGNGTSNITGNIDSGTAFCARPREGQRQMTNGYVSSALIDGGHPIRSNNILGFASHNLKCDDSSVTVFVRATAFSDWIASIASLDETVATELKNRLSLLISVGRPLEYNIDKNRVDVVREMEKKIHDSSAVTDILMNPKKTSGYMDVRDGGIRDIMMNPNTFDTEWYSLQTTLTMEAPKYRGMRYGEADSQPSLALAIFLLITVIIPCATYVYRHRVV